MASPFSRICDILRDQDDFLVTSHFNPDGDALGSTCAMGHILNAFGKQFQLYNASGKPSQYDFLQPPAPLRSELPAKLPAWTIVLDCGSDDRMAQALRDRAGETQIINIDHHLGNNEFGVENWVDPKQPAVGSMMALVADELGVVPTDGLAEALYLAVATDTGFFTYGNTTPESLEMAATLLRNGLDIARMNMRITKQWSENRMDLWTTALSAKELFLDKQVALTVITREMFNRTGTTNGDTENIINFLRRLKTVRVAVMMREEAPNEYKFSLRSYGEDNVQAVASRFNGGGHKNASGGSISASIDEAKSMLISAIGEELGL